VLTGRVLPPNKLAILFSDIVLGRAEDSERGKTEMGGEVSKGGPERKNGTGVTSRALKQRQKPRGEKVQWQS